MSAAFTLVVMADWCAGNGATISGTTTVTGSTNDLAPANDTASANTAVIDGGACDDGSACTTADACSGAICTGTPGAAPPEVAAGVLVQRLGTDAVLSWGVPAGAATSSVVRGRRDALPVGSTPAMESCVASRAAGTTATDTEVPPVGAGFWYLVRAENACGPGTYGYQGQKGAPTAPEVSTACP